MSDLEQILPLWRELAESGSDFVLATVVAVEGSGYRKPGARMMIAPDSRRAGTISGGCLEAEVAKKAFWHTENGPAVRTYSTAADDGDVPFGMGCGGVVHVLLERPASATPLLERLAKSFELRLPLAIATGLDGKSVAMRAYGSGIGQAELQDSTVEEASALATIAARCFARRQSMTEKVAGDRVWAEWVPARPGLFVFGAGDDAFPLIRLARQLGWYVAIADGRSNLATRARFPEAHDVQVITSRTLPEVTAGVSDAAVLLTHSLEQDTRYLAQLLDRELAYLGVLGPRRRTLDMLRTIAESRVPGRSEGGVERIAQHWLEQIHAPMGLDLGGDTPSDVALAVVAEIQQCRHRTTGLPLKKVRAAIPA